MKLKLALAIIILLSFSSFVIAGEDKDQSQTSGGDPYYFYYGGHGWAKQEFVPTKEIISKIKLKLGVDYGTFDPCRGAYSSTEKIDIEIRDSGDNDVAYKRDITVCGLGTQWEQFGLTQTEDLEPGEKYKIFLLYRGNILAPGYFYWDRSSSNRYSAGNSETNSEGTASKDFAFETYGQPACTSEYFCEGNSRYQRMRDCNVYYVETCSGGCVGGVCSSAAQPSLTITAFDVKDSGYHSKTTFDPGEEVVLYASVTSLNGVEGSYNIFYDIYKGTIKDDMDSDERTAPGIGYGDNPHYAFTIPSHWQGDYRAEVRIDKCGGTCTALMTFTVNGEEPPAPTADYRMINLFTTDPFGRAKTVFSPEDRIMLKQYIRNYGGAGSFVDYFDVYGDSGENVWHTNVTGTANTGQTSQPFVLFEIPDDWYGTYTFTGSVEPCSTSGYCERTASFSVHEICQRQMICVDETVRGYQMDDCSILRTYPCWGSTICQDGVCITPTCNPADCGVNAGCVHDECACNDEWGNCDGEWSNGCEAFLIINRNHCGTCGNECGNGEKCFSGECVDEDYCEVPDDCGSYHDLYSYDCVDNTCTAGDNYCETDDDCPPGGATFGIVEQSCRDDGHSSYVKEQGSFWSCNQLIHICIKDEYRETTT
ncbi:MAG: hypothetical protein KJ574_00130, partial [Nanoarchaeota archaeon]|nr:hypothetical protein [Nanoarchaeota archaeon]